MSKNTSTFADTETEQKQAVCPEHGEYTSTRFKLMTRWMSWTSCPECAAEAEAQRKAEEEAKAKRAAEQRRANLIDSIYRDSGIPLRYAQAVFKTYKPGCEKSKQALASCRSYVERWEHVYDEGLNLIMTGTAGTGKTHLAIAVMHELIEKHTIGVRYTTVSQLIRAIRSTYNSDSGPTEQDVFDSYSRVPLLVLDEIGVKYASDFEKAAIFEIIDNRYNDRLPTVLISNLALKAIAEVMGERTIDRLSEGGSVLAFQWESYRGRKRADSTSESTVHGRD